MEDRLRVVDLEHSPAERGPGAGPRGEAAAALIAFVGGAAEIDLAVVPRQHRRQRRLRVVLRIPRQLAPFEKLQGLGQRVRPERAELDQKAFAGLIRRDRE